MPLLFFKKLNRGSKHIRATVSYENFSDVKVKHTVRLAKRAVKKGDTKLKNIVLAIGFIGALLASAPAYAITCKEFETKGMDYVLSGGEIPMCTARDKDRMAALSAALPGTLPKFKTMEEVNAYFNRLHYTSKDLQHWKSPKEFLASKEGDCADFSVAKAAALNEMGYDAKVIVGIFHRDAPRYPGQEHAVVLVDGKYVLTSEYNYIRTWSSYQKEFTPVSVWTRGGAHFYKE